MPSWLSPEEYTDVTADLDRLHRWRDRNAHRNDAIYVHVQKPANDLHIERHERMLKEEPCSTS